MNWRVQASLLFVVGALGATLWLTNETSSDKGSVSVSLLANHRIATAVRMQWQFADEEPIEVRRQPGGPFRIVHPIDDLLAQDHLVNLASTFDSAMVGETPFPDDEQNRARTGLDKPRLMLEIDFEDGAKEDIEIGSEGPLGSDLFVRRKGAIYRGGLALFTAMKKSLDDLRERQVFSTPPGAVREVLVDRAQQGGGREVMKLARAAEGWRLMEPFETRAATASSNSFVGNILAMRIDLFVNGPIRLPDTEPDLVITLRGGTQDEVVKVWRDTQDNLFGRLEGRKISFKTLNQQAQRIFTETADELRSRILIPLRDIYHEALTMMVDGGDARPRIVISRDTVDSAWQLAEPIRGAADPQAANELVTAINNLRVMSFVPRGADANALGLATGALAVAVQGVSDQKPHQLRLGRDDVIENLPITYASPQDAKDEIVAVPKGAVDMIRRPWTDYVPRSVFSVLEPVTKVDLSRRSGAVRQLLVDDKGAWIDRAGSPVADDRIADIVDRLRDLQCKHVRLAKELDLGEPDWSLVMGRNYDPADAVGFGAIDVFDRDGKPLVVRRIGSIDGVVFELSPLDSDNLRQLWQ